MKHRAPGSETVAIYNMLDLPNKAPRPNSRPRENMVEVNMVLA